MSIAKEAIAEIRLVASSIQVEFGCLDGSPARHNGHNVVPVGDVSVLTGTQLPSLVEKSNKSQSEYRYTNPVWLLPSLYFTFPIGSNATR